MADWRMAGSRDNPYCLQCGELRSAIRAEGLFCATVTNNENGYETDQEWDRHRFKPYSEKELAGIRSDEEEMYRQMGDFADFVQKQEDELAGTTERPATFE